jgi:hypothetical protein
MAMLITWVCFEQLFITMPESFQYLQENDDVNMIYQVYQISRKTDQDLVKLI